MKFYKQCVGIDISKDKFDCCLSAMDENSSIKVFSEKIFNNNIKGFESLLVWIKKHMITDLEIQIVMEATGVYYENLAYYLSDYSVYKVCVLLPLKAKYYFKSLALKTKTDKVDAKMLSQMGLERSIRAWRPMTLSMKTIKLLSREFRENKRDINRLKNQLHAKEHTYRVSTQLLRRLKDKIDLTEQHCLAIELELKELVRKDTDLWDKLQKLVTIPGVRFMTAISIIAETNGFALIKNAKQLASYAGLDVVHNSSGNRNGRTKISKRGNKYIRQALYMPSLSASKHINHLKEFYGRVNEKNKCKKIGLIGVSRKLLILMYTLWKNDEHYRVIN